MDGINTIAPLDTTVLNYRESVPLAIQSLERSINPEKLQLAESLRQIVELEDQLNTGLKNDKLGLVVPSGQNSAFYNSRRWTTLDIEPAFEPTIVKDAGKIIHSIRDGSLDYLVVEYMVGDFDPNNGDKNYYYSLADRSVNLLKPGGILKVDTTDLDREAYIAAEGTGHSLPHPESYVDYLNRLGFKTITVAGDYVDDIGVPSRHISYYGFKPEKPSGNTMTSITSIIQ